MSTIFSTFLGVAAGFLLYVIMQAVPVPIINAMSLWIAILFGFGTATYLASK